ncbi:hypothetical protein VTK56DRAFT_1982 [Thermocarpiscus australiensis]
MFRPLLPLLHVHGNLKNRRELTLRGECGSNHVSSCSQGSLKHGTVCPFRFPSATIPDPLQAATLPAGAELLNTFQLLASACSRISNTFTTHFPIPIYSPLLALLQHSLGP